MKEDALLTSKPEPTNEAYAIAKICGLKLCEFYRQQYSCVPFCNANESVRIRGLLPPRIRMIPYDPADTYGQGKW